MKNDKMARLICRMNEKKRSEHLGMATVTVKPIPEDGAAGILHAHCGLFSRRRLFRRQAFGS